MGGSTRISKLIDVYIIVDYICPVLYDCAEKASGGLMEHVNGGGIHYLQ